MRPPKISRQSDRHVAHGERNSGTNTKRGDLDVVLDFVSLEAVAERIVSHGIRFDAGPGEADVRGDLRNAQVKVVRTFNEALQDGGVFAVLVHRGAPDASRITILISVGNAIGHRHTADVRKAIETKVLVITVDLVNAGLVVRRAVAEERTELGVVEDKSFGTEEAGSEVDVHGVAIAFGFAPVTDTGGPDTGATIVDFSGATFTHAANLIHDRARDGGGVHDESIAGRSVEVIIKSRERIGQQRNVILLGAENLTAQFIAGSGNGCSNSLFIGILGKLFDRDAFLLGHRNGSLVAGTGSLGYVEEEEVRLDFLTPTISEQRFGGGIVLGFE